MIIRRLYLMIFMMATMFSMGCESLEDTYKEYAGNGIDIYLGKCSKLNAVSGWEKIELTWNNSVDPSIDKIRITWSDGADMQETVISKDNNSHTLTDLKDGSYEIKVYSVDINGNNSKEVVAYGRPFTHQHDAIKTFTKIAIKHFYLNEKLYLILDKWAKSEKEWNERIIKATIVYFTLLGEKKTTELSYWDLSDPFLVINNIDQTKPVHIERIGKIEGCPDDIVFKNHTLDPNYRSFTTDFIKWMKYKYGVTVFTPEFINSVEELDIDYSCSSLEDILYFPNLKKLNLGKNRFLYEKELTKNDKASRLYGNVSISRDALRFAKMSNDLKVYRYNKFYFNSDPYKVLIEMGNPIPPTVECYDASNWEYSCSVEDDPGFNSMLSNLFDNDPLTAWQPQLSSIESRSYKITIDMKETKSVNGFKIVQKTFDSATDTDSPMLLASSIKIWVSKDGLTWVRPFSSEDVIIGNTNGEITIIPLSHAENYKYIRFEISDLIYGSNFGVRLSDFMVY